MTDFQEYNPPPSELEEDVGGWGSPFFERKRRQLRYDNRFAIRLTTQERSAARVRVTVETLLSNSFYLNEEYNPHSGLYWRYTAHDGDIGVVRHDVIRFTRQVVFDFVNTAALCNYWGNLHSVLSGQVLDAYMNALLTGLGSIPAIGIAIVAPYNFAVIANLNQIRDAIEESNVGRKVETGLSVLERVWELRAIAMPPGESLWKFTAENDFAKAQIKIDHWPFPEIPEFFLSPPAPSEEGEEPIPPSENDFPNNPDPVPETPPPDDQSDLDPRNEESDYDEPDAPTEYPPGTMWRCSGEGGLNADPGAGLVCRGDGNIYVDIVESTFRPYFVTEPNRYLSPDRGCTLQRVITSNGPASTPSGGQIGYFRNAQVEGPL